MLTSVVPFRVLCVVRTCFKAAGGNLLYVTACPIICFEANSRASSRCKHDIGVLLRLNAKAFKRAPTPLFGGLVRCFALGHSFAKLW